MARVPFNDAYKQWRNKARQYSRPSLLQAAMADLGNSPPETVDALRRAPWLTFLMVKWIFQDEYYDNTPGLKPVSVGEFDHLKQRLWDLPSVFDRDRSKEQPLRLFMRQLVRPQIGFQRPVTFTYLREAALVSKQPAGSTLRRLFFESTSLEVEEFMDLSFVLLSAVLKNGRVGNTNYFGPLVGAYREEAIRAFIDLVASTEDVLRTYCRSLPHCKEKVLSEYFEFPMIRRYPIFRRGNDLLCWHQFVLYRGLEELVHTTLSTHGQDYMKHFSRLFEQHVTDQARNLGDEDKFLRESDLKRLIGADSQVPDALIPFGNCNVLVESKAGLFDESVMTVGHNEMFLHKTRALKTAVNQAWGASVSMREQGKAPDHVLSAKFDYLLIITNRDLGASRGTALESIYPSDTLVYPSEDAERLLPLTNIYILSIDEFERLVSVASTGSFDVPSLLASCVEEDMDPANAAYEFAQHLNRNKVPMAWSSLVQEAVDACEARITEALGSEDGDQDRGS